MPFNNFAIRAPTTATHMLYWLSCASRRTMVSACSTTLSTAEWVRMMSDPPHNSTQVLHDKCCSSKQQPKG